MSAEIESAGDSVLVCEFCGFPIEDEEQRCAALDDGRCLP